MASISNVPREIDSSMRDAVGSSTKIYIKRMMKLEVKPEKFEKRVVALAGCRLMVLTAKVPTKVEQNISYLDIQVLESKKENQLSVTIDNKTLNFVTLEADTDEVNLIITHIGRSIKNVFPAFPLERFIRTIEVHPPNRLKTMYDLIRDADHKETGPCGGFSMMYACMCDYYNLPYREEVAWDVDTIYLSQDSRELCLQDFDHLNSKDLIPIVSALEHNTWFTKLNANDVKLNMETQNEIQKVMLRNAVIEELHLSNTGITADFVSKLATAVLSNTGSQLSKVDLSKNTLSDQALISFIGSLKNLSKGLVSFNIASTKVTGKGLNKIAETLSNNPNITLTLQYLNMSDNPNPKGDDLQNLYSFLAQPNNLTHLDLSGIDCSLESLCGALLRGSCSSLTHLYVARNAFSHRKGKEVIPQGTWKTFFSSVYGLEVLDLSTCKLPHEALKELLLGVASNINIKNLHLDLSNNDLQTPGAAVLGDSLSNITSVTSLDISNNGFDQSLEKLLDAMKANSSVKHLAIGQNFTKVKNPPMVLESVVNLIQDENSTIESLSLADSKLKNHLSIVINALGSNTTLTEIDISGNSVGDLGARMLSKALQINNKLRTICWDRNNVGPQGFEDVASALKKNFTVKKMPSPLIDIGKVLEERKENSKERTEMAIKEIESVLQRNHSPQKYSSDQGYRLQQGFLISSTQQMVDRLVVQVQDTINALGRLSSGVDHQGDVDKASSVIKDADNSKQLLPQLQNIAMKSCDVGNPIEKQLQQMAADLKEVLNKQMKKTVSEMVECTTNQCAGVTADKTFMEELVGGCSEKSSLPPHFTKNVLDSVETSVYNKLSELNLAVAAYISDKTLEGVIEALHSSHKTLTNKLNKKRSESVKSKDEKLNKDKENQEKAENEENEKPVMRESKAVDSPMAEKKKGSAESPSYRVSFFEEKNSPSSTPDLSTKRKNFSSRRMRPPTVVDAEQVKKALMIHEAKTASCISESDLELGSEVRVRDSVVSISSRPESGGQVDSQEDLAALDTDKSSKKPAKANSPSLPPIEIDELPSLQAPNLQHLGKNRAKGPQRRRPSPRPQVEVGDSGLKEDEGLNSFFQSNVVIPSVIVSPEPSKNEKKPTGKKPERKESLEKSKVPEKPEKPSKTEEPKKKGFFARRTSDDKSKGGFSIFSRNKKNEQKQEPAAKKPEPPSAANKPEPPPAINKPESSPLNKKPERKVSTSSGKNEDSMSTVSEEREETENEKTKEEQGEEPKQEKSEEQEEAKNVMRPKKPIGGIGIGIMGNQMGNIMSEMKRFSQIQLEKKQRMPDKAMVPPSMLKKKAVEKPSEASKPKDSDVDKRKEDENVKDSVVMTAAVTEETQKPDKDAGVVENSKKEEKEVESQAEKVEENSEKEDSIPNGESQEEKEDSKSNTSSEDMTKDEKSNETKEEDQKSMETKEEQEKEKENRKSMEDKEVHKTEEKEKGDRKSMEVRKSIEIRKSMEVKEEPKVKENEEPEKKRHSILATVQARQKPSPAPRGTSTSSAKPETGENSKTSSTSSLSSNSSRASDELKPKPSPPVKPRPPPKTAPKPKAGNDSADAADASDKQEEGVIVDSATLRLSVGEKIKRLSQNFSSNPPTPENAPKRRSQNFSHRPPSTEIPAAKTSSLPRDLTPASLDDADKEKVKERTSLPLDGKDNTEIKEDGGDDGGKENDGKTNNGTDSSEKSDSPNSDNNENGVSPEEQVIMV